MDLAFLLFISLILLWIQKRVLPLATASSRGKKVFSAHPSKRSMEKLVATVKSIHIYPIKSCHGVSVEKAVITSTGFQYDRNWMLVRESEKGKRFVTARQLPAMVTIRPEFGEKDLLVNAPGMPTLKVPFSYAYKPETSPEKFQTVTVWKDTTYAADEGNEAADWFNTYISKENPEEFSQFGPLRLVRYYPKPNATSAQEGARASQMISPGASNEVAFPDAHPFLLVLQESVDEIDRRVENLKVHQQRFRGNIIISGTPKPLEPFTEEKWVTCTSGDSSFFCLETVERCKLTTIEPDLGIFNPEQQPLLTVNKKETNAKCFGVALQHTKESEGKLVVVGSSFYASSK